MKITRMKNCEDEKTHSLELITEDVNNFLICCVNSERFLTAVILCTLLAPLKLLKISIISYINEFVLFKLFV